ncbi:hypothetical protein ACFJYU_12330 [Enterococcus faecalis]
MPTFFHARLNGGGGGSVARMKKQLLFLTRVACLKQTTSFLSAMPS